MRILVLTALLVASFAAAADTVQLREDAPDRHVVVKGDTLWDISAKFLKSPWKWPELWRYNKKEIKNPHWIYPGQVLVLVRTPQGPRLSVMETVKLSPTIRSEPIPEAREAIPTIPYAAVQAFLGRPLVASPAELANAPTVIGAADTRSLMSMGDRIYASSIQPGQNEWNIVRIGKALKDPDSGEEIARELIYIGNAKTAEVGSPGSVIITQAEREVEPGDLLVPAAQTDSMNFTPSAPAKPVDGKIISAYGGSQTVGNKYSTVIIDKGSQDGLERGNVLAILQSGRVVGRGPGYSKMASFSPKSGFINSEQERGDAQWTGRDVACLKPGKQITAGEAMDSKDDMFTSDCKQESVKLPDRQVGHVLLYRVFDRVAYGLVMDSSGPIYLLDTVRNP